MAIDHDIEREIHQASRPASLVDDLFTTRADRVLRRVEAVLDGRDCSQPLNNSQRGVLKLLHRHQGKAHALSQAQVCAMLKLDARQVRGLVQDLRVTFEIQVGASRESEGGGYYLISTDEESVESTAVIFHQAASMLRTVLVMRGGGEEAVDKLLKSLRRSLTEEAK